MVVVVLQDPTQKLVFGVVDGLDDIFIISREIEEAAAFTGRSELGKDVFAGKRDKIVGRIQPEDGTKATEDPGCIILELEVVLRGWSQLVSGSANQLATLKHIIHEKNHHTKR